MKRFGASALLFSIVAFLPASPSVAPASASAGIEAARDFRERNAVWILLQYSELLSLPNVAGDEYNIRRNAEMIKQLFEARGTEIEVLELEGASPLVIGRLDAPGAERTIGIYVHYDGQPVDPSQWAQSPWEPTYYTKAMEDGGTPIPPPESNEAIDPDWRIYARSAGDDKLPFPAVLAAIDALAAAEIERTSNLVFLFEGEEEIGSPYLDRYLEENQDKLEADVWLICDGPMHQSRRPQLVFGVRGFSSLDITVYGATRNLHSGHYGNWAPNPGMMLAHLLASMKDDEGRVLIEGFYDSVEPIGEEERRALETVPNVDEELKRELGLARTEGEPETLSERILIPSLNVRGLVSAGVGDQARNMVPNTATASIDVRLVRGNEPDAMLDLVEAHIERQGYTIVREEPDLETRLAHPRIARVKRGAASYPAARTSMSLPIVAPLREAAHLASGGQEVILTPTLGGSLPLYLFNEILEKPVIIVPIANHDDNQHAPNENVRIGNLWYGIDLMAGILTMP